MSVIAAYRHAIWDLGDELSIYNGDMKAEPRTGFMPQNAPSRRPPPVYRTEWAMGPLKKGMLGRGVSERRSGMLG